MDGRAIWMLAGCLAAALTAPAPGLGAPSCPPTSILVYHRFGPAAVDSMTVRTETFRRQLTYLRHHRHPVIPLRDLVGCFSGGRKIPANAVVITADDGHRSVFTDMLPLVREFRVPVTLFIYPSAISNASYALTWEQVSVLRRTRLFDIQSHTYWHPNFKNERRRLGPQPYREFVTSQLVRSRRAIADRTGEAPDELAWPFGIYDAELGALARDAGYEAGFTLDRRPAAPGDSVMALPRFLVTDDAAGVRFAVMLSGRGR